MNQTLIGKTTKMRSSNLELYRIICMLMIVAHHFVVNSGLTGLQGPMTTHPAILILHCYGHLECGGKQE